MGRNATSTSWVRPHTTPDEAAQADGMIRKDMGYNEFREAPHRHWTQETKQEHRRGVV